MNPSETYIKMCEKAEELQEQWQPNAGDYIGQRGTHYIDFIAPERLLVADSLTNIKEIAFWLPRQDQLWKMLPTLWSYILHYHGPQLGYCLCADRVKWSGRELESVLLQACLFLIYRKRWNGKEWIDAARNPSGST